MKWTEGKTADLRKLWNDGLATAEIGRRLEVSKNAVVSKAHHINLQPRKNPSVGRIYKIQDTCIYGHPLTGSNLIIYPPTKGRRYAKRQCRICKNSCERLNRLIRRYGFDMAMRRAGFTESTLP